MMWWWVPRLFAGGVKPRGRYWVKRIVWTVPKGEKHPPHWWADYILSNWDKGSG